MSQEALTAITLSGLVPPPEEQWAELRAFVQLDGADLAAMGSTLELLLRHGAALVRDNYAYLQQFPATAAILGWETGADEAHLEERRRFMTLWLSRTLGLDLSADLARYLFRAGQIHAGHGPRQIHVPPLYITGAVSRVQAAFAHYMQAELPDPRLVGPALAGWNKYLAMHLHMMLAGYGAALARDGGPHPVTIALLGRLRSALGQPEVTVQVHPGATVADALRKFFNYYPDLRPELWVPTWTEGESRSDWMHVERLYELRPRWNIMLGGRDLRFYGGLAAPIAPGDRITISPPGR